jgi:hypothetical protein
VSKKKSKAAPKSRLVNFRFSPELEQQVDAICRVKGVARLEAVRQAVGRYCRFLKLDVPQTTPATIGRPKKDSDDSA